MNIINESKIGSVASGYGLDTGLVLFFLAMEFGRGVQIFSMDGALMSTTMAMLVVLPYYLPTYIDCPSFTHWMVVRSAVSVIGITIGFGLRQTVSAAVPDTASFLPMTFLILAGMVSCYIQFYGLMKLRLAK
jgi:hypothetical protein